MRLRSLPLVLLVALVATLVPRPADARGGGKVFLTVEEALHLAFPDAHVERTTVYLTKEEEARARALAGHDLEGRVVRPYVARDEEGHLLGTAYFDTHTVRSKRETLMVVVGPDERIARVEVLAFAEPPQYLPRGAFYAQFVGHGLDDGLEIGKAIRGVSGASLTSRATTRTARATLALHRVVREHEEARRREEQRRKERGREEGRAAKGSGSAERP